MAVDVWAECASSGYDLYFTYESGFRVEWSIRRVQLVSPLKGCVERAPLGGCVVGAPFGGCVGRASLEGSVGGSS